MFLYLSITLLFLLQLTTPALASPQPPITYPITRRGGSFPLPDTANLTFLLEEIRGIEKRLRTTHLVLNGNTVVRNLKKPGPGTQARATLVGEVGREGNWFAELEIGTQKEGENDGEQASSSGGKKGRQKVDMDLDMLTADWFIKSTRGRRGSYYLDFRSGSYVDSEQPADFPTCRKPTDIIHLPYIERNITMQFAHCRPAKQWISSLEKSGAYLGLAIGTGLKQIGTKGFLEQLVEEGAVEEKAWEVWLKDGKDGIFTIGSSSGLEQEANETRKKGVEPEGINEEMKRGNLSMALKKRKGVGNSEEWNWSKVQGPDGWWEIIMKGIWIDGNRILNSQPAILDINTPFILAPPLSARSFYSSISGSRQLPPPYDQFHAYPCFNPPKIQLQFGSSNVDVLRGKHDRGTFAPGGRFSLGRLRGGSGYCVGIVVEGSMGRERSMTNNDGDRDEDMGKGEIMTRGAAIRLSEKRQGTAMQDLDGLEDIWILGEPFFRDVKVMFDAREKKVGIKRV